MRVLTAMIATTHHIPPAWNSSMTAPHREDCLRWQGQAPGKQRLLREGFQGTQFGGKDCSGLWGRTSQRTTLARVGLYPKSLHRDAFNSKGAWLSRVLGIL